MNGSRVVACALQALVCAGCQVLIDVDPQCAESSDCVSRFGPGHVCTGDGACAMMANIDADGLLPPRWECLDSLAQPAPPDPERTVQVRLDVYDYADGQSLSDVTVRICSHTDITCSAATPAEFTSDQDGVVEMDLAHGFDGHFELSGEGVLPLILYDIPFVADVSVGAPMLRMESLAANTAKGGEAYREERGFLLLMLFDCSGMPAGGIRLEAPADPDNPAFYFDGPVPSRDLQSTVVSPVGRPLRPLAMAGFINMKPGFPTVRGFLADTDTSIGRINRRVAPGSITLARFQGGYE
jgi:hypothetical protein